MTYLIQQPFERFVRDLTSYLSLLTHSDKQTLDLFRQLRSCECDTGHYNR